MSLGFLNLSMLIGIAGAAVPVVIHLFSKRREQVVDWGAMQFLEVEERRQRRFRFDELLLLALRMLVMGLVAAALARPFLASGGANSQASAGDARRDVVIILDASASMSIPIEGRSLFDRSIDWIREFSAALRPGDSLALLLAKDRVRPMIDPPTFDFGRIAAALTDLPAPRGGCDLTAAIVEALRILESTNNPEREIIILSDETRSAWRVDERAKWELLRSIRGKQRAAPRLWSVSPSQSPGESPASNGSLGPLQVSRGVIVPGREVRISGEISNSGSDPRTRSIELLIDGEVDAGATQVVGPIAPGGRSTFSAATSFDRPGDHVVTVRFADAADSIPSDDETHRVVTVVPALEVILVDGKPSAQPLGGELGFVRVALAPFGDPTRVVEVESVDAAKLDSAILSTCRVVILANVDRLGTDAAVALESFIASGGGAMVILGDRVDAEWWNESSGAWLPAKIGEFVKDASPGGVVGRPAPSSFRGPALEALGGSGQSPLGEASFASKRRLEPMPNAAVLARLDGGDPWIVERGHGRGRALLLGSGVGAEAGTLPVNPDFVPWIHRLVADLGSLDDGSKNLRPGEDVRFAIPVPPPGVEVVDVRTPDGRVIQSEVVRGGNTALVSVDASDPGVYRLDGQGAESGGVRYATVEADPRESNLERLSAADRIEMCKDWPFVILDSGENAVDRILRSATVRKHELWRPMILSALALLCVEIWMTRRATVGS
ncbi:MAG: BatA domain-containing protein [Isosphaeraceae bacterium]|nr:BatA domain-containing protein [Isosphaeraceae bacterium]